MPQNKPDNCFSFSVVDVETHVASNQICFFSQPPLALLRPCCLLARLPPENSEVLQYAHHKLGFVLCDQRWSTVA